MKRSLVLAAGGLMVASCVPAQEEAPACPALGSPLKGTVEFNPGAPIECEDGSWPTELTALDMAWTIELTRELVPEPPPKFYYPQTRLVATSDGVVANLDGVLMAIDARGELLWSGSSADTRAVDNHLAYVSEDRLAVAGDFGQSGGKITLLEASTGAQLDHILFDDYFLYRPPVLAWDGSGLWAVLVTNGDGIHCSRHRLDAASTVELEGSWEATQPRPRAHALNDAGTLAEGRSGFLRFIDLLSAEVSLEIELPNSKGVEALISVGDGFVYATRFDNPQIHTEGWRLASVDASGNERWSSEVESTFDPLSRVALAARSDGSVVFVGSEHHEARSDEPNLLFQPFVLIFDSGGERVGGERIGSFGIAEAVAVGPDDEIYVAGVSRATGDEELVNWLRRYE